MSEGYIPGLGCELSADLRRHCSHRIEELRTLGSESSKVALQAFDQASQSEDLILALTRATIGADPKSRRVIVSTILTIEPTLQGIIRMLGMETSIEQDSSSNVKGVSLAAQVLHDIGPSARGSLAALQAAFLHHVGPERICTGRAVLSVAAHDRPVERLFEVLARLSDVEKIEVFTGLYAEGIDLINTLLILLSDPRVGISDLAECWLLAIGEPAVEPLLDCLGRTRAPGERVRAALSKLAEKLSVIQVTLPSGEALTVSYRQVTDENIGLLVQADGLSNDHDGSSNLEPVRTRIWVQQKILSRMALLQRLDVALSLMPSLTGGLPAVEEVVDADARVHPQSLIKEQHRYTDVEFFNGHVYPSDYATATSRMLDVSPLCAGGAYTLGVTIRARRLGVSAETSAPVEVRNRRAGEEELNVYVAVASDVPSLNVAEPLLQIAWPHDEDSDTALFRFEIGKMVTASEGTIEIRLYDQALDLLSLLKVHVVVVVNGVSEVRAKWLEWPDRGESTTRREELENERRLAIHVRQSNGSYEFEFLSRDRGGAPFLVSFRSRVTLQELNLLLVRVRNLWTKLAVISYARQLSVSRTTFDRCLRELRELGQEAWMLIFGGRTADQAGASEAMGQLLSGMHLQEDCLIQISHSERTSDFIFPWALLHPPVEDDCPIDPMGFWGVRFCIEQVTRGPTTSQLSEEPVQVLFALDPSFENSIGHDRRIADYVAQSDAKLVLTGPLTSEGAFLAGLSSMPAPHLVYVFCHGYTAAESLLKPDGVQVLRRTIEEVPDGTPERKAFETLLRLTSEMDDDSWMFIGNAQIRERKLLRQTFFERRRPIVFLNMCQSADLLPSMSSGFVRLFLDKNAVAVVGTESPMTEVFASAYAEKVLEALFGGESLGASLLRARRHFLQPEIRNPLGLAYTLYGRASARLGAGPLTQVRKPESFIGSHDEGA